MTFLDGTYYYNTLHTWLLALLVTACVLALLAIGKRVIVSRLLAFAQKTRTNLDDLAVDLISRTHFYFLVFFSLYAGTLVLTLPDKVTRLIGTAAVIVLLVQAAVWGNRIISVWLTFYLKRSLEQDAATATTVTALGFVGRLALWTVTLLLALDNMGVDITALVAGLGIGGIAVALALQNVLGDLFASLSIVLDKPFLIGDFVVVGDFMGTVEHIGLKTTRIRSLQGEQIVFSNADLLGSRIRNYKRMQERRVVFTIGVTYQTPYEKLAAIPAMIKAIIEQQPQTRFDRAHFKEYGDFSLNFEVVYYVLTPDYNTYMDIQQAINLALFRRFEEERIEFAYPTQTLFLQHGTAAPSAQAAG